MNHVSLPGSLYQAVPGFEDHLIAEFTSTAIPFTPFTDSLFYTPDFPKESPVENSAPLHLFWHQNRWLEPFRVEFASIKEAAQALRAIQRNWSACLHTRFRRGALIAEALPPISARPRPFPWQAGDSPVGAWTLLDAHTMIASARCSSPFPNGVITFAEDKDGPPSRAYLKLWEALARLRQWPSAGERCLDAGASPGGWTWALARLGARVVAVDRAPLEDRVAALPGVSFIRHDAFTLKPEDIGPVDWLFCDVACYPHRLFRWVETWLESGLCRNYICTIKMQGSVHSVDFETPRLFAAIPGSEVVHLYHNKHELTWSLIA